MARESSQITPPSKVQNRESAFVPALGHIVVEQGRLLRIHLVEIQPAVVVEV